MIYIYVGHVGVQGLDSAGLALVQVLHQPLDLVLPLLQLQSTSYLCDLLELEDLTRLLAMFRHLQVVLSTLGAASFLSAAALKRLGVYLKSHHIDWNLSD